MLLDRPRRFGAIKIFDAQRRKEFAAGGSSLVPEDQPIMHEDYLDISHPRGVLPAAAFRVFLEWLYALEHVDTERMDPDDRAESLWYRTAGLAFRHQKDLAVDIIEAEIRSVQREALLEAAKLVLTSQPVVEIARQLREAADTLMQPKGDDRKK